MYTHTHTRVYCISMLDDYDEMWQHAYNIYCGNINNTHALYVYMYMYVQCVHMYDSTAYPSVLL